MYVEIPIQLTVGQTSGQATLNIPSPASYVSVINNTPASISFAPGTVAPGPSAVTIGAGKTYSGQMLTTQTVTAAWTSPGPIAADNNTVLFAFSDQPITLSVSDTNTTNVTGTVNAQIDGTVDVTGDVTITNSPTVNISGTPTVNVTNEQINTFVGNTSTQAVPVQQQSFYGTGEDGDFNPQGSWNTVFSDNFTDQRMWSILSGNGTFSSSGFTASQNGTTLIANFPFATACKASMTFKTPATVPANIQIGIEDLSSQATSWWAGYTSLAANSLVNGYGNPGNSPSYWTWETTPYTLQPNTVYTLQYEYHNMPTQNKNTMSAYLYLGSSATGTPVASLSVQESGRIGQFFRPRLYVDNGVLVSNYTVQEYNYTFQNTPNEGEIKNFKSVTIPDDMTIRWANPTQYVLWFADGNVQIDGVIMSADAMSNGSTSPSIRLFNAAITLPHAGNGGAGGSGGGSNSNAGHPGGAGGTGTAYGSGQGGAGGGGTSEYGSGGTVGGAGGSGYGVGSGGYGGSGGTYATASMGGTTSPSHGTATFIIIANGNIIIDGTVLSNGANGGNGGNGGSATGALQNGYYWASPGGGGGGCGTIGGSGSTMNSYSNGGSWNGVLGGGGGGGAGGAGGGVVVLYAAMSAKITGVINVNGGQPGSGGLGGSGAAGSGSFTNPNGTNGSPGQAGQAGQVLIYQYNQAVAVA